MQQLLTKEKHEVIQHEVIQKYVVEIYLLTWKDVCNIVTNNIKSKLQLNNYIRPCFSFLTL